MNRKVPLLILAALAVLLIPLILLSGGPEADSVRGRVAGDVEEALEDVGTEDLPARARAFLDTDRPWRAARAMDRYLERMEEDEVRPEERVLAARAYGGSGGWREALALLEAIPAVESYENGLGAYLLGRARDEAGDDAGAVEAYRAFLVAAPAGELEDERRAARLRLGLALIRAGAGDQGREVIEGMGVAGSRWIRLLQAEALAATGDTAGVRAAVSGFTDGIPGLWAWRSRVAAARSAGDLAGARSLANRARAWAGTTTTQAEFLLTAGRIALEMGDVAAARDAFRGVIDRRPSGGHARSAAALLREGEPTPADHLAMARVAAAQGLHEEAIDGFRRWLEDGSGGGADRATVHHELASSLFYAEEYGDVEAALRPVAGQTRARLLLARAEAHRGQIDEAVDIYTALARRGGRLGAEGLFLAAGTLHDAGEDERATEIYRVVVRRYPGTERMGLATMRLAGIAFEGGDYAEAARLWDGYRTRYPRGDRGLQATYWAGRAREAAGDVADAEALYREVLQRERDSYYALMASRRLNESFWPLPLSDSPPASAEAAARVTGWMREMDLLREAGFPEAASALADDLVDAVGGDRATRYALAEALADRGYSQRAIRIGITLEGSGPPNVRLLRILYPFPYRTLITEEARDRGLDLFIAAALIRQESMFEVRITSPAGARGLMQIMPPTGRRLAEAVGIEEWDADLLYHPEINVHLGIRYVAQHMESYDGSLPSVFSAYNAGSHRVRWWSEYPEYGNDELFTERIPYKETRDYVKILTRNRALYSGLYSGEDPAS